MWAGQVIEQCGRMSRLRELPLRLFGYANEIAVSFLPVSGVDVNLAFALRNYYIVADTSLEALGSWRATEDVVAALFTAVDVFIWQNLASVVLPGFIIPLIKNTTQQMVDELSERSPWSAVFLNMTTVLLVMKPVDLVVDYLLDSTLRPATRR